MSTKENQSSPDHLEPSSKAKSRWLTVEPILFLAFIGNGTIATIRSEYLQKRIGEDKYNYTFSSNESSPCITNTSDPDYITQQNIQQDVSRWILYLSICSSLPLIFTSTLVGTWSDKAGRKIALGIPVIGMILQSIVYLLIIALQLPLVLLIIGDLAYGLSGGGPLLVAASLSYTADITTMQQRTFRVVVVETTLVFSLGVSQLVMGFVISALGFVPPFYVILACHGLALAWVLTPCILYETIGPRNDEEKEPIYTTLANLWRGVVELFAYNVAGRRWRLLLLTAMFVCITESSYGYISVITIYVIGEPFCWSSVLVGIFMSISVVVSAFGMVAGSKLLGLCMSDIWMLHITMISSVAAFLLYGFANETIIIFIAAVIGVLRSLSAPIVKSMASKSVTSNEQGAVFAFLASMESIAIFLSPIIFQPLYSATVKSTVPGVSFLVAGGLGVVAAILGIVLHCGFLSSSSSYRRMSSDNKLN